MTRLFIAAWPTDDLVDVLRGMSRKDRPGIRWVKPENWHVTLRFLGEAETDDVATRLGHLTFAETDVRYGPGIDVLHESSIVLPAHGFDALAGEVARLTSDLGTERPRKRFVGHLTLARLRRQGRIPGVIGARLEATQRVSEIALVASTLHPDGPVYEMVETWTARPSA